MRARSSSSVMRRPSRVAAWAIRASSISSSRIRRDRPMRSIMSGVSRWRSMRSYCSTMLAWARRKRSPEISSPLTVATTFGLLPPPLMLVPKYTTDVTTNAITMITRMNFRLLKYSRMLLITDAAFLSDGSGPGPPAPRDPRASAQAMLRHSLSPFVADSRRGSSSSDSQGLSLSQRHRVSRPCQRAPRALERRQGEVDGERAGHQTPGRSSSKNRARSRLRGLGGLDRGNPCDLTGHDAAGDGQEPGVGHHPMKGPHRGPVDVPRPEQRLERLDQRVPRMTPERLAQLVRLDDRGHIGEEDAARAQHAGHRIDESPGLGQIEHRAVDGLLFGESLFHGPEPDGEVRDLTHPKLDVRQRAAAEILALLVAHDPPARPHRAQERERERPRAHPGLEYAGAGKDVGPEHHDREVLRVDDLGAARHVEHVLGQGRAQRQIAHALRALDPRAVGLADDRVVRDPATVRVKRLALAQDDEMALAALIDQERVLAVLEPVGRVHGAWPAGPLTARGSPEGTARRRKRRAATAWWPAAGASGAQSCS